MKPDSCKLYYTYDGEPDCAYDYPPWCEDCVFGPHPDTSRIDPRNEDDCLEYWGLSDE